MDVDLNGKVALVCGGTAGIGRATALQYARCGATVIIQGRSAEAAQEVIEAAAAAGAPVAPTFLRAELYEYDSMKAMVDAAAALHGRIDIAVANGGNPGRKASLFEVTPQEDFGPLFIDRVMGRLNLIHAVFPVMKQNGYGKIVVITTDAGRVPTPSEALIGAAASSLIFLTRALAREFARHGVRVNAIATTLTTGTKSFDDFREQVDQASDRVLVKAFQKIEQRAAFGLNRPEDLAELATYLAAKESDQLSGATISINGGVSFPQY